MSWLKKQNLFLDFSDQAHHVPTVQPPSPWQLQIFEVTGDAPDGRRFYTSNPTDEDLLSRATFRVIFAPLDLPRRDSLPQILHLFHQLDIPDEFTTERTVGASHSFARRTTNFGFISWFHFLCKNIELIQTASASFVVRNRAAELKYMDPSDLPEADYSWHRSGFFLRYAEESGPVFVCFGPSRYTQKSFEEFFAVKGWRSVEMNSLVFFDLVLEGLYFEIENTVKNMKFILNSHEHKNLSSLNTPVKRKLGARNPFTGLHNCAKHVIHLTEAISSCLLLTQTIISASQQSDKGTASSLAATQLQQSLQYRLSLFNSTNLKLTSLQKRIDNAINLSFNLVTQQDSLLMIQDSTTMRAIAVMTMIFLPTTGVATVVGSQLLVTTREEGRWEVFATPLFWVTWWVAVPLTILVGVIAWGWHLWARGAIQGYLRERWARKHKGVQGSGGEKG